LRLSFHPVDFKNHLVVMGSEPAEEVDFAVAAPGLMQISGDIYQ
jgi:hypothetical protein